MLELDDVSVHHGRVEAVRHVSLGVTPGQITLVLGPNGAGKSSTLGAVAGLFAPVEGRVLLDGVPLTGVAVHRVVRAGIALVPEGRRVFAPLTVEENLRMGAYTSSAAHTQTTLAAVNEMFPILHERRRSAAGLLSGGEQQMLAFGRALMSDPTYLLLDEPSMGLAPAVVEQVVDKIGVIASTGIGVLMVEQNAEAALGIAHDVAVLSRGEIVFRGTAAEVSEHASVLHAFLGDVGGAIASDVS
ncbi:MAG: ABC-type branched-chain amino acid transport system ATPase component [Aeromicrobium sp.]|jgi:branched-chain amino acid transport system ATP-binding protein|nr:ABC-type branched-chain amino acid transport system ATPase component [Aeromicrobium sp.]